MKVKSSLMAATSALIAGALTLFFAPRWISATGHWIAAYDVFAIVMLATLWLSAMHRDPELTRKRAAVDDPGRTATFFLVLGTVAMALVAAIFILGKGHYGVGPVARNVGDALALAAVVLGWLLIQTVFLFRYAHMYYGDADRDDVPDRGLIFPGDLPPNDYDFAYFSFVLGMTFQVSDVQITARRIRRAALVHGLISFAYSVTIFALSVNVLSGLLQSA